MWSRARHLASSLAPACMLVTACQGEGARHGISVDTGHGVPADAGHKIASDGGRAPATSPSTAVPGYGRPALCTRPGSDTVRDIFCANDAPSITSLSELEGALGLHIADVAPDAQGISGFYANSGDVTVAAVFLTHSTALSGDLVSPINPRAILFDGRSFLAFNRGVQQVEIASADRTRGRMNFYLLRFGQACSDAPSGCSPSDLFTPRIESSWTHVALEDDEDLKNTPQDCRQCHQRGTDKPLLLMRELDGPWTHFFAPDQGDTYASPDATGRDLVHDYLAAKGTEGYAAVPSSVLRMTIGFTLENMVSFPQPLVFDGTTISGERWPWNAATGYATQPVRSATWDAAFAAFQRGEQLALPFYASRATDPVKQQALTEAYARYAAGELDGGSLPDLADIFPADPVTRAEIGLQTVPGATPAQTLVQACGPCHNDQLDQTISRARFNVALARLDRSELDIAIERLTTARGAPGSMPPPGRRQIDPDALQPVIDYLRSGQRSADDDALLERAAVLGMTPERRY